MSSESLPLVTGLCLRDVTLAVLAGGEGARMGRPKGELKLDRQPILDYLLERWFWSGPTLLVTAPTREHPPGRERFDREAVDPVSGQGPLRGVLTALDHLETHLLLVTTVDMPAIRRPQLLWLVSQLASRLLRRDAAVGLVTQRNTPEGMRIEPFPCVLTRAARDVVRSNLESGVRSVHSLSKHPRVATLDAPASWDEGVWANLNRPSDLDAFSARHGVSLA